MKPFPIATPGGGGLNVSLHLILMTLAIIAGFFLMFRELRRMEMDLHDSISRTTASVASAVAASAVAVAAGKASSTPPTHPVYRFDNVVFPPTDLPTIVPTCLLTEVLPPVPEEPVDMPTSPPPPPPHVAESGGAAAEAEAEAQTEPPPPPQVSDDDALQGLSEDQLMARPASELREYLRRREASTAGNKAELAKRIMSEKKV